MKQEISHIKQRLETAFRNYLRSWSRDETTLFSEDMAQHVKVTTELCVAQQALETACLHMPEISEDSYEVEFEGDEILDDYVSDPETFHRPRQFINRRVHTKIKDIIEIEKSERK